VASHRKSNANQTIAAAQKPRTAKKVGQEPAAVDPLVLQRTIANPEVASAVDISALQRIIGNQAVTRLIQAESSAAGRQRVQLQEEEEEAVQERSLPDRQAETQTDVTRVSRLPRDNEEGEDLLRMSTRLEGSRAGGDHRREGHVSEETSRPTATQAQFELGTPGDVYEQEADRVAEQVAQNISSSGVQAGGFTLNRIRDMVSEKGISLSRSLTGSQLQTVSSIERDGSKMLRVSRLDKSASQAEQTIPSSLEERIRQGKGQGDALSPSVQATMGDQLGHNFTDVRVKTDAEASELTQSLGAKAFTNGSDIWLGQGESVNDVKLMAHELTHVVQQGAAPSLVSKRTSILDRAPASEVLSHLQAVLGDNSSNDASIYRKEIRQFLRENDSNRITTLRRQILESPAAEGISQKDGADSVRLAACGGGAKSFPTISTIAGNSNVKTARNEDWSGGEKDFLERSGWVMWNAKDDTYKVIQRRKGDEFGVNPGAKPADNPPTYCVGHYHTHPPLSKKMKKERKEYHKETGKEMYPVAPSDADKNFANGHKNPGVVEDFLFASRWPSWLRRDYYYGPKQRPGAPESLDEEGS
jgi:hypothetical protein